MFTREAAVIEARDFIGTPYRLQGRLKGSGVDCGTLLAEYLIIIGRATYFELRDLGFYSGDWFHHTTDERYLRKLMKYGTLVAETICRPGESAQPGDLVLFKAVGSKVFNHGAIVTEWPRAVHAEAIGVRERNMATAWLTSHKRMTIFDPWGSS